MVENVIIDGYDFYNLKAEKYWSLPKSKDPKVEIHNLVFSNNYLAARKVDGNWCLIIKDNDGNFYMRGRSESVNGGYTNKVDWIPHVIEELDWIPNGSVLLGEIYIPSNERSRAVTTILGCLVDKALERQKDEEKKLHFYCFDLLAWNGVNIMNTEFGNRVTLLYNLFCEKREEMKYNDIAIYFRGKILWDYIGTVLEQGWEGVVLQLIDGKYEPGKRPAWKSVKVKKEIGKEIDLFITGKYKPSTKYYDGIEIQDWSYWIDERTDEKYCDKLFDNFRKGELIKPITKGYYYGWAGSIELGAVNSDGNIVPVAWISNLTEDVKKKIKTGELNKQVVKVSCMEIEPDTLHLRHAKITEYRKDKNWKECEVAQLYEN